MTNIHRLRGKLLLILILSVVVGACAHRDHTGAFESLDRVGEGVGSVVHGVVVRQVGHIDATVGDALRRRGWGPEDELLRAIIRQLRAKAPIPNQ